MVVSLTEGDAELAGRLLEHGVTPDKISTRYYPRLKVLGVNGYRIDMAHLSTEINRAITRTIEKMKLHDVKTLHFSDEFLTIKVIKLTSGGLCPLSYVRSQVVRTLKLTKSPSMPWELATLYKQANPQFSSEEYRAYFSDIQNYNTSTATSK